MSSDSETETDAVGRALRKGDLDHISGEIEKCKRNPSTSGMFVSGWDDDDEGVNEEKHPHETPEKEILWAAENGQLEVVRNHLRINPELVKVTDDDKYTPLHRACYNNHIDVVNLLLSFGAPYDAKTMMGWQPLHSACQWNHSLCISRLLAAGADVNARSTGDQTPLHIAASVSYCVKMLQILLMHPDIDPFIKNKSNDSPRDIAKRTGIYEYMFEMAEPALNYIKSREFTFNPFMR